MNLIRAIGSYVVLALNFVFFLCAYGSYSYAFFSRSGPSGANYELFDHSLKGSNVAPAAFLAHDCGSSHPSGGRGYQNSSHGGGHKSGCGNGRGNNKKLYTPKCQICREPVIMQITALNIILLSPS